MKRQVKDKAALVKLPTASGGLLKDNLKDFIEKRKQAIISNLRKKLGSETNDRATSYQEKQGRLF